MLLVFWSVISWIKIKKYLSFQKDVNITYTLYLWTPKPWKMKVLNPVYMDYNPEKWRLWVPMVYIHTISSRFCLKSVQIWLEDSPTDDLIKLGNAPGLRGGKWCEIMPELCFSVQHGFGFWRKSCEFPPNMNEFASFWKNSLWWNVWICVVCVIFESILLKTCSFQVASLLNETPPAFCRCSPCKGLRSWFVELRWGKHSKLRSPLWWVKRLSVRGSNPWKFPWEIPPPKKTVSISKDQR